MTATIIIIYRSKFLFFNKENIYLIFCRFLRVVRCKFFYFFSFLVVIVSIAL